MILEICAGSLEDCIIAAENGANRVELNSALELGGLTPSFGLVKLVKQRIRIPVISMLRSRAGNFVYSDLELATMLADAEELIKAGVDGIAFGILDCNNRVDVVRCKRIISLDPLIDWVFHRAFDDIQDKTEALEILIDLGVKRVLTSGGAETALQGLNTIKELQQKSGERICILPGSGINSQNVAKIITKTGCLEVHASLSKKLTLSQKSSFSAPLFGTDPVEVKKVCEIMNNI